MLGDKPDASSSGPPSSSSDLDTCARGVSHLSYRGSEPAFRMNRDDVSLAMVPPEILLQIFLCFIGDEISASEKHYGVSADSLLGKESSVYFVEDSRAQRQLHNQRRRANLLGTPPPDLAGDILVVDRERDQLVPRTSMGKLLVVASVCRLWRRIVFRSGCEAVVDEGEGQEGGESRFRNRDHPMLLLVNSVLVDSLRKRHRFRVSLLRYGREGKTRVIRSGAGVSRAQFERARRKERRDLRRWKELQMMPGAGPPGFFPGAPGFFPGALPAPPPMVHPAAPHCVGGSEGVPPAAAAAAIVVENPDLHEFLRTMGVVEGKVEEGPKGPIVPFSRAARRSQRRRNRKYRESMRLRQLGQRIQTIRARRRAEGGDSSGSDDESDSDDDDFSPPMWPEEEAEHEEWRANVVSRIGISSWEDDLRRTERRIAKLQEGLDKVAALREIPEDGEGPPAPPPLIFRRLAELKRRHCNLLKEKTDPESRYYEERIGYRYTLDEIFEVLKAEKEEESSLAMILRIRAVLYVWINHLLFDVVLLVGYICFVLLVLRDEGAISTSFSGFQDVSRLAVLSLFAAVPTIGYVIPESLVIVCTVLDIYNIRRLASVTGCRMRDRMHIETSWKNSKNWVGGLLVVPLVSLVGLFVVVPVVCFDDFDPDSLWNSWILFILARILRWAVYLLATWQGVVLAAGLGSELLRKCLNTPIPTLDKIVGILFGILMAAFLATLVSFLEDYWYFRPLILGVSLIVAVVCFVGSIYIAVRELRQWFRNGVRIVNATMSGGGFFLFDGVIWALTSILWGLPAGFARWGPMVLSGLLFCIAAIVRTLFGDQNQYLWGNATLCDAVDRVKGISKEDDPDTRCLHDWRAYRMNYFQGIYRL